MIVAKEGDAAEQGDGLDVSTTDKALRVISHPSLASALQVGTRIPSFKVLNQADARPWHLQELLKSDGRWRIIVFAGNVSVPKQSARISQLGDLLAAPDSFLRRYTPQGARYDSIFELLTVHAAPRVETSIFDFHEVFRPFDPQRGWDYWKIYVDDESYHEGHGQIYRNYGIDSATGCTVIIRPDQYISYIGPVDDYDALDRFFTSFMIPASDRQG